MYQKKVRFIFGFLTILALLMSFNSTSSAQELEKQPLHIVQLGDSYSAGNGVVDNIIHERVMKDALIEF